nr:V-type ATPase 116kDa subunit family protein [Alkalibaculum sporogenes]
MDVTDNNLDEILGFAEVQSGLKNASNEDFVSKSNLLQEVFGDHYTVDKKILEGEIDLKSTIRSVNKIYDEIHTKYKILKMFNDDINQIQKSIKVYNFLSSANIEMDKINNMENFHYTIGTLSKENVERLKNNYSNITAIVVHVGAYDENEVYVVISPYDLETETNRILKSLNFNKLEGVKSEYTKKPSQIVTWLQKKKNHFQEKVELLEKEIDIIKERYKEESNYDYNVLHLYEKIHEVMKDIAFSKEHFYFSGWIPVRLKKEILAILSKYEDMIIMFNDNHQNPNVRIPTKLKNNWLFKPFETFIKMYGVPLYEEVDPTPFLSISYLFLFGFMFGDLGQGFVLFLLGNLARFKGFQLGSIISRLGISSMFFGLLYGSFFGFETIIKTWWLKPFSNVNTILIAAIVIGVTLILIGYIYGIVNQYKSKDYYNSVLSRNGVTGLVLYFCIILVVLALFTGNRLISIPILSSIILAAIVILLFKEPIIAKLSKANHNSSHKLDSSFFVESFFEVFEILMSIVSNTLSFIRIGAFALNHVGLFIAFESLAHMVNSGIGSTIVYILGNIFIIGLEGLIVGIQVLRLEYYELFSKYFQGGGIEFKPAKL